MKLHEIVLQLQEETLQAAIKRLLKPAGTLSKVMGKDTETAAKLLQAKSGTEAFTLNGETPISAKMLSSVVGSRSIEQASSEEHGSLKVVKMMGGARLLVVGSGSEAFVVTTDYHKDQLVEEQD